ncbi:hypothetical protein ACI2KG_07825 [Pseudomonas sp. NPDC089407]|uniref:hypothetical protein n=1 Tax=Pseudomonas sp. NPDC089407 TaxID=3364464 RepID=UPI00384B48D8
MHLTNKEATDQSKRDGISRSAMDALTAQAQELQMGYEMPKQLIRSLSGLAGAPDRSDGLRSGPGNLYVS